MVDARALMASLWKSAKGHPVTYPLVGCCAGAVFLASATFAQTTRKHGITFNRWSSQESPQDAVPWDKNTQKWVALGRKEKELFKDDRPFRSLVSQIYGDGRYAQRGHAYVSENAH